MAIELRQIGLTGIKVTKVSFGCASIGNLYREVSDDAATEVLDRAWARGIRYFDTAPHYGRGRSEVRLGAFLSSTGRDAVVSTKVGRLLSPGQPQEEADGFVRPLPNDVCYDYSGDGLLASLEGSQERLGRHYIDIVYVHDIGEYTHGAENARHLNDFFDTGYETLVRLKEEGRIGAIGLGVNENRICLDIMKHCDLDAILLAGRWTLLDRSAEEELVRTCAEAGTSLVLGGVFNSGILATGAVEGATYDYGPAPEDVLGKVRGLEALARELGLSLPEAAMHFAVTRPGVASVLIGTMKTTTLEKNLAATELAEALRFHEVFG